MDDNVDFDSPYSTREQKLEANLDELRSVNVKLRLALQQHHTWHTELGVIGLPDYDGDYIELDMTTEYMDSDLCERTVDALRNATLLAGTERDDATIRAREEDLNTDRQERFDRDLDRLSDLSTPSETNE